MEFDETGLSAMDYSLLMFLVTGLVIAWPRVARHHQRTDVWTARSMSVEASEMTRPPKPLPGRRMDLGRLAVLPVMALLGALNVGNLWKQLVEPESTGAVRVATLTRGLLVTIFYVMILVFYLARSRARSTTGSAPAKALAVVATFLPLLLGLTNKASSEVGVLLASSVLITAGMAWSVWSLWSLGRSFSIIPQARRLVRRGPYAVVRHPLYLGELTAVAGVVLGGFTPLGLALLAALAGLQLYRTGQEEQVLARVFPEYEQYRSVTPRVLPRRPRILARGVGGAALAPPSRG